MFKGLSLLLLIVSFFSQPALSADCPRANKLLQLMHGDWAARGTREYANSDVITYIEVMTESTWVNQNAILKVSNEFSEYDSNSDEPERYSNFYYIRSTNQCRGSFRLYEISSNLDFSKIVSAKFDGRDFLSIETVGPYQLVTHTNFKKRNDVRSISRMIHNDKVTSITDIRYLR